MLRRTLRAAANLLLLCAAPVAAWLLCRWLDWGTVSAALSTAVAMGFGFGFCCCGGCSIFSDVSDDQSFWTIGSGSWTNLNTSSTGASITCNTVNPAGTAAMAMSVAVAGGSGTISQLKIGISDSTHFHYVELKFGTGGYARLYRYDGSATLLGEQSYNWPTATTFTVILCVNEDEDIISFRAESFGTYPVALASATTFPSGSSGFGLATHASTSGTSEFGAVAVSSTAGDCPSCPSNCIACPNDGQLAPPVMTLTLSGLTNAGATHCNCAVFNGSWEVIRRASLVDGTLPEPDSCLWESATGQSVFCTFNGGLRTHYPSVWLDEGDADEARCHETGGTSCFILQNLSSDVLTTCDPVSTSMSIPPLGTRCDSAASAVVYGDFS